MEDYDVRHVKGLDLIVLDDDYNEIEDFEVIFIGKYAYGIIDRASTNRKICTLIVRSEPEEEELLGSCASQPAYKYMAVRE